MSIFRLFLSSVSALRGCCGAGLLAAISILYSQSVWAQTELQLLAWRASDVTLWQTINEQNLIPDVRVSVTLVAPQDYEAVRLGEFERLTSQYRPDMVQSQATLGWLKHLDSSGALMPLDAGVVEQLVPGSLSVVSGLNGQVYGVPFGLQTANVHYDKTRFASLNLDLPKTQNEWLALMSALKRSGVDPLFIAGGAGWWMSQVWHEAVMAALVPEAVAAGIVSGSHCFTDPAFIEALAQVEHWRSYLNDDPALASYQDMLAAFALGDVAMIIDGPWATSEGSPLFQMSPDRVIGSFPLPGPEGSVPVFAKGGYLGLSDSDHPAAVARVMAFLASKSFAQLSADITQDVPAYQGDLAFKNPNLATMANRMLQQGYGVSLAGSPKLAFQSDDYAGALALGYRQLLAGEVSPYDLASHLQQQFNPVAPASSICAE